MRHSFIKIANINWPKDKIFYERPLNKEGIFLPIKNDIFDDPSKFTFFIKLAQFNNDN